DSKHLKRMFAMRIERIEPELGIEAMSLAAPRVERLDAVVSASALGGEARAPDISQLVDQLSGRVGEEALFRISSAQSDVPERAVERARPLAQPTGWPEWRRPVRLLRRPEQLSEVLALL